MSETSDATRQQHLLDGLKASDLTTQQIPSVRPDAEIWEIARAIAAGNGGHVYVVSEECRLLGEIAVVQLIHRPELMTLPRPSWWARLTATKERLPATYVAEHARFAEELMTPHVPRCASGESALSAVSRLEEAGRIELPVEDDDHCVVGLFSLLRVINLLARQPAISAESATDDEIEKELMRALRREPWVPSSSVSANVRDGVVHLWGEVFSWHQRQALRVLAESIPGVLGIEDHLTGIEPNSGLPIVAPLR